MKDLYVNKLTGMIEVIDVKNSKQVNLSMSVIATLDRIREQLPKRGTLKASYGDAVEWLDIERGKTVEYVRQLESEIRILKQKKVRK